MTLKVLNRYFSGGQISDKRMWLSYWIHCETRPTPVQRSSEPPQLVVDLLSFPWTHVKRKKKKNTQWNKQPAVQNSRWEVKIWKWRLTHSSISTPPVETPAWWGPVCASRVPSAVSSPPRSDGHRGDWMRKLFNNRRHFLQKRILKLVWSSSSLKATGHIDIKQDIKQTRTVDFDHQHVHWTCIRKRSYLRLNIYS